MTHLWPQGAPIRVEADAWLTPHRFEWQAESHRVQHVAKRWRVDTAWWQGRIWREYFKLVTTDGLLVILYRDLLGGGWFLQRVYD